MKIIKKSTAAILAALLLLQLNTSIFFTTPNSVAHAEEQPQTETVLESETDKRQLMINTTDWTNNTTPEIEWSGVCLDTENEIEIQYQINEGEWQSSEWTGEAGNGTFAGSEFAADGEYRIKIRCAAEILNAETSETEAIFTEASNEVIYKRDADVPVVNITSPKSLVEANDTLKITGSITDGGSGIGKWVLEYESNDKPGVWEYIAHGISEIEEDKRIAVWDLSDLPDGFYTIRLTAYDNDADDSIAASSVIIQKTSKSGLVTPFNLKVVLSGDTDISARISWECTQSLQSATYNVYRCSDAELQDFELIESDIEETYWVDETILYGEEYYYKVSAVVDDKESKASAEIAEIKLDRMLGLENYWTYTGFETDKGKGYVNLANGNLVYAVQDSVYLELLPDIPFTRVYNSQSDFVSSLGYGWDCSFNISLYQEKDADNNLLGMILKDCDGSLHYFAYDNEAGSYVAPDGQFNGLTYNNLTGEHTLIYEDGMIYIFGDDLKIERISISEDEYINFTYDEYGNMIAAENHLGETIIFDYYQQEDKEGLFYTDDKAHAGLLAQITDISGKSYVYEYIKGLDVLSMATLGTTSRRERYYYEEDICKLKKIVDTANESIGLEYFKKQNKVSAIQYIDDTIYEFEYNDCCTIVSNESGYDEEYNFNDLGNVIEIIDDSGNKNIPEYNNDLLNDEPTPQSNSDYVISEKNRESKEIGID